MLEGLPFEILHDDEGLAFMLADLVNRADVRVVQHRGGARFAFETFESLRVQGEAVGQELERYKAAELGVLGLVDHAHPSAAELFQNAVVCDRLANH
jgi:hypothetical protein